jgi:hypothetical protein
MSKILGKAGQGRVVAQLHTAVVALVRSGQPRFIVRNRDATSSMPRTESMRMELSQLSPIALCIELLERQMTKSMLRKG